MKTKTIQIDISRLTDSAYDLLLSHYAKAFGYKLADVKNNMADGISPHFEKWLSSHLILSMELDMQATAVSVREPVNEQLINALGSVLIWADRDNQSQPVTAQGIKLEKRRKEAFRRAYDALSCAKLKLDMTKSYRL